MTRSYTNTEFSSFVSKGAFRKLQPQSPESVIPGFFLGFIHQKKLQRK